MKLLYIEIKPHYIEIEFNIYELEKSHYDQNLTNSLKNRRDFGYVNSHSPQRFEMPQH